ncbi:MAG: hypothetical protein K6G26_12015, partial [Lachnospiraceae bacterium]|nr:hypothetical protein [Lachnospiraceae bacterium]
MVYLVITVLMIGLYTIKRHSFMNAAFLFAAPYVLIILLNNNVMVESGYYPIKEATFKTLFVFTTGLIAGSMLRLVLKRRIVFKNSNLDSVVIENSIYKIKGFLWFVIIVRLIDIFVTVKSIGLATLYDDDFEALQLSGFAGHLTLLGTAMAPYIYKHYLKNKNKSDLLLLLVFSG